MTLNDRVAALSLAKEPQKRDGKGGENIGGLAINKKNGSGAYGEAVAGLLLRNNGVYSWDMNDPINGISSFDNIHQAMAADIYAPGGSLKERVLAGEEYESDVRSGIGTLSRWLDDQFGVPLFRCKKPGYGNKVAVVTVNPDVVVDEDTGKTAAELQYERDKDTVRGQVKAAYKRIGRQFGETTAAMALREAVSQAVSGHLPAPKRERLEDAVHGDSQS